MKLELIPVVRYWDYNSKEIFSALDRLRESGVESVAAWVPWSHLESDRHHLLQKFVRQAMASGLHLRLGVTPELGIGYANGGIPDELLRDRQNLAQDRLGHPFYACVPPNIHPLVSLLAPAVFQRYGHFLLKLAQELTEVLAENENGSLEIIVSDSLFKHYKNTGLSANDHGDFSLRHMQFGGGYRKEDWTPMLAEKIFHSRAYDFLESRFKRFKHVSVQSKNVFARECSMGRLLEELMGSGPNHKDFFLSLTRGRCSSSVAWLDDLHHLRDRERNFLVSSSLILYGEVWMNDQDYFSLSNGFRTKLAKLISGFSTDETRASRPAVALVQNRFSPARVSTLLQEKLGPGLRFTGSIAEITKEERERASLFVVEEGYDLELRQTMELLSLAKTRDCTVVLFRSSLCEAGLKEFHKLKTFRLNHGWLFEIGMYPDGGHVLLVEGQENAQLSMDTLGDSLISVARIDPFCSFDKGESGVISMAVDWELKDELAEEKSRGQMKTLFLMNPSPEPQKFQLEFTGNVRLHGLHNGSGASTEVAEGAGKSFETELPPLSVIPLGVLLESDPRVENSDELDVEDTTLSAESAVGKVTDGTQTELA